MTLADFTNPGMIIPHLCGKDVTSVIKELSQTMQREGRVPDLLPFYHAVLNREFLVGTDMESGIAFPHARMPALKEVSFAFGRSDAPVLWGTKGMRAVSNVFVLAVPATDSTQYLLLISGLGRLSKNGQLMEQLKTAETALDVFEVFQRVEVKAHCFGQEHRCQSTQGTDFQQSRNFVK